MVQKCLNDNESEVKMVESRESEERILEDIELGAKIALQGVKEKINNITEEMTRKGIDTKYFESIKAFINDRLAECEINEKG